MGLDEEKMRKETSTHLYKLLTFKTCNDLD